MAKLTRISRRELMAVLYDIQRARAYIERADIAIGKVGSPATTTLHYTRQDGSTFYPLAKDIGSDLVGLPSAESKLALFLQRDAEGT